MGEAIEAEQPIGELPGPVQHLLFLEGIDQVDGGEEPHLLAMMLDGLDPEGRGDVGLAGGKIEAGEVLVGRKRSRTPTFSIVR